MADIVPAVAQQTFTTQAASNMDKIEDIPNTFSGPDEDDNTSSSNGTEVFDRVLPDVADWRGKIIDGSFSPICAAMSGNSTGLSSMSSSVAAEDLNIAKTKNVTLSRKRSSDGSFKPLSAVPMTSTSPKLTSSEQKSTVEVTTATVQPVPKKRGRPPKIKQPGADLTTPTANSPKTARSSASTNQKAQVRPRSSIPSQLPADILASQCIEAARGSRLSPYGLHSGEHKLIGHALSPKEVTIYLNIRNRILRLWKQNSLCSVTVDEALGCAKETRFFGLASVAYRWLVRNGYINFGCVEVPKEPVKLLGRDAKQRTVIVIGAGVSGLTTARQLEGVFAQEAGKWAARGERPPRVVVLEGRERIGGRVYSKPLRSQVTGSLPDGLRNTAEMGAMIVTGFEHGNPLDTVIRAQLGVRYHLMRDSLTIYDTNGRPVNERADMLNTELYTDISDRAGEFRAISQKKITALGDEDLINRGRDPVPDGFAATQLEPLTAGQIRSHQPAARRGRRRNAPPGTEKLTGRSEVIEGEGVRFSAARAAKSMGWQIRDGVSKNQSVSLHQVASASAHPTLGSVMDEAIVQYQSLVNMTPTDMRLLNWHHANLEYANAAPVTSLSLSGHDQDTGNEFEGAHSEIIGGYTQVPCGLMNLPTKLDVRFGHTVESIHYDDRHPSNEPVMTKVVCTNGQTFDADEVVMTVPLGVLKSDAVDFDPPLPSWKQDAIDRMGFGLLNKVILLYEESFWDESRDMFGLLNEPEKSGGLNPKDYENKRGRFYLIWNASKTSGRPMLIALMAGHAAYDAEYTGTEVLMDEVTERLRGVFGPKVPKPIEVIVTRWRRDRFTRGTYSYVARDTLPSDYDTMARPVGNLHFAGEATCGTHPATVHGALLSGLRVASDVVEAMVGPVDVPEPLFDAVAIKQETINGMSLPKSTPTSSRGRPSISIDTIGRYQATPTQPYIKSEFSSATLLSGIAPATKASRPHFVLQPAGPPAQSVCASDASFWTPTSSSKGYSAAEREATIIAKIHSQIGDRPLRPSRPGVNPFLIYTKDKWEECKAFCNRADGGSSTATSPNKAASAPASRDMIRQTIGKWWKAASEEDKRPFLARSQAAQTQADLLRKQWDIDVAKWDADAVRLRREIIAEEQQPKPVQPAPVEMTVPSSAAVVVTAPAAAVGDAAEGVDAAIAIAPPPLANEGTAEPMVLS